MKSEDWIPVTERLPEPIWDGDSVNCVLLYNPTAPDNAVGYLVSNVPWFLAHMQNVNPPWFTHWQSLVPPEVTS